MVCSTTDTVVAQTPPDRNGLRRRGAEMKEFPECGPSGVACGWSAGGKAWGVWTMPDKADVAGDYLGVLLLCLKAGETILCLKARPR